ncbi:hypothetical protein [Spongiactinospora gelatinilytica]|nr:hypothetical protein [Spongiactinospora gelatinilytica]
MKTDQPEDPQCLRLKESLQATLERTEKATPWRERAMPPCPPPGQEGAATISTPLSAHDLVFLEVAREEVRCFAGLVMRLLDLHRPRDAGGITSDAANPIMRCRSCMWRWPCPTFRAVAETLDVHWWNRRARPIDQGPPEDHGKEHGKGHTEGCGEHCGPGGVLSARKPA